MSNKQKIREEMLDAEHFRLKDELAKLERQQESLRSQIHEIARHREIMAITLEDQEEQRKNELKKLNPHQLLFLLKNEELRLNSNVRFLEGSLRSSSPRSISLTIFSMGVGISLSLSIYLFLNDGFSESLRQVFVSVFIVLGFVSLMQLIIIKSSYQKDRIRRKTIEKKLLQARSMVEVLDKSDYRKNIHLLFEE